MIYNNDILDEYKLHLRAEYDETNTWRTEFYQTRAFLRYIDKTNPKEAKDLEKKDMLEWKIYLNETFMHNGNVRRITSINHFLTYIEKEDIKLPTPKTKETDRPTMSPKEIDAYLNTAMKNPLWRLIVLAQRDFKARPSEYSYMRISKIDFENHKMPLEKGKTDEAKNDGLMSPELEEAITDYLQVRTTPRKGYEDYLIIIPDGRYKGLPPTPRGSFILNQTRTIAMKAGINKDVTPYVAKPSFISDQFRRRVDPKIIQRTCRHKHLKSTMLYNKTYDEDVLEYFKEEEERRRYNIKRAEHTLEYKDRIKSLADSLSKGEIDPDTFKKSVEMLHEDKKRQDDGGIGYV